MLALASLKFAAPVSVSVSLADVSALEVTDSSCSVCSVPSAEDTVKLPLTGNSPSNAHSEPVNTTIIMSLVGPATGSILIVSGVPGVTVPCTSVVVIVDATGQLTEFDEHPVQGQGLGFERVGPDDVGFIVLNACAGDLDLVVQQAEFKVGDGGRTFGKFG